MQYHCVSLLIFTMTKEPLLVDNPFFFDLYWSGFPGKPERRADRTQHHTQACRARKEWIQSKYHFFAPLYLGLLAVIPFGNEGRVPMVAESQSPSRVASKLFII